MLQLKFASYHRAVSLSSHASSVDVAILYWLKNHWPGSVQTPS